MGFHREPKAYERTALSDLKGAWENLREEVIAAHPFPESDRILLHIEDGMSWEAVRDLDRMKKALLLVRNLVAQVEPGEDVVFWVEQVQENLDEVLAAITEGERL